LHAAPNRHLAHWRATDRGDVVAALDRRALAEGREIDRRLAADVLAELAGTS